MRSTQLRDKLQQGRPVIGPFVNLTDPQGVEVIGLAGFDFCILDHEHGRMSVKDMEGLVRAAEVSGTSPVIRVQEPNASKITTALDTGAEAVQVPNLATAEHARDAVRAARYFEPGGERGTSPYNRGANYNMGTPFDARKLDEEQILIIQVEGEEGLANLDSILAVPGYDGIFLGPNDIARSLGLAGQMAHPKVVSAVEKAAARIREKGIFVGTFCATVEQAHQWIKLGVQYISIRTDLHILGTACSELVERLREG